MMFYKEANFALTSAGEIPKDWSVRKLQDIAKIVYGKNLPMKKLKQTGYPVFGANGIIGYHDRFMYEKPQVLISCRGAYSGEINISPPHCFVTNNSLICEVKNQKVDTFFLYYALKSHSKKRLVTGSAQPQVTINNANLFEVAFPSVAEQKQIVEILSCVDLAVAKADEVITKTERLKNGLMQKLLTRGIGHKEYKQTPIGTTPKEWEVKKASDLFVVETGTTPSTRKPEYWNKGTVNWITPTDLSKLNGKIHVKNSERKITEQALKETSLAVMPKGSLIISTRAPVGYVAVLEEPAAFNQGCKGLIPKNHNEILSEFYCYYLLNKKQMLENLSSGSTFIELSKERLQNFNMPSPSFAEQKRIAELLLTIDQKIELESNEKSRLERIKHGLMDLLLTGKVRVKVD